jgi:hypothetical protein
MFIISFGCFAKDVMEQMFCERNTILIGNFPEAKSGVEGG